MTTALPPSGRAQPARWRDVFRVRPRLTVGLILLESVTAVQLLIVVTIMPVIVEELGGINLYGWAFSSAALATMIALPATARLSDRWGPARALALVLVVFAVGTVIATLAPTMPIFVAGRFLQGWGLGAQYAVALGAVARSYPEEHRPRILALLSGAWVLPSLVGPSVAALLASTVGWRWAFAISLPFVALAAIMVVPEFAHLPSSPERAPRVPWRALVLLAAGTALLLSALSTPEWWSIVLGLIGVGALIPGLGRILPPGALVARPGLGAGVAASFLLNFVFFSVDGFLPLLLTGVRGKTVAVAGLVVTLASVSWSLGSWWQSRAAASWPRARLVVIGGLLVLMGALGVGACLWPSVPLLVGYVAWTIGGLGMGVAFPTISLVAMESAPAGGQTSAIASTQLTETLGASVGPGIAGSSVALAAALGASLTAGLAGGIVVALIAALVLIPVSVRLPNPAVVAPAGA